MNAMIVISAVAAFFGVASLIAARYSIKNSRDQLYLIEINSDQADALEKKFYKQQLLLEETNELVAQQERLIARLESKVLRRSKPQENQLEKLQSAEPGKTEMIERRRRVLKLASRGHDANSIASTLGMLPGEVELIVNLNGEKAKAANYA